MNKRETVFRAYWTCALEDGKTSAQDAFNAGWDACEREDWSGEKALRATSSWYEDRYARVTELETGKELQGPEED